VARTDYSLTELADYRPAVAEPEDFDTFWRNTLAETDAFPLDVRLSAADTPYQTVQIFDVSFAGFGGDRINAWLARPAGRRDDLPALVEFLGYGGGRDVPGANLEWASAGYAHLLVDTRGQGSRWGGGGDTPDPHGSAPSAPGFMTRGINSPETYYYRRVFTDGVRAVAALRSLDGVDADRVAVHGVSQGGGISLAVAGLVGDLAAVLPDVPFLCHFERAVDFCENDPYAEITRYLAVHRDLVDQTFATLAYFDGVNFARRAAAPALFSVGLMDQTTPPSTVYAAYNAYAGPKEMVVYRFNDHEGGKSHQRLNQVRWLGRLFSLS
jgi:cephalosporin-C deacetylase